MKVAFLNLYSGANNRGAESFAHELAWRLGDKYSVKFYRGVDYTVKVIQPEHNVNNPLKRLFLDSASLATLAFTLKIFPDLWREKYDWVVPMNGFWQVLLCKIIGFFRRTKILVTGHSGPGWDERWNLFLKPDVFVATTEPTAEWAKRVCPWTKIVTIPYGIDIGTFAKAKPAKLDLEKPIILCPAAAVEYKRIDLAIKAVAKMGRGSLVHLGTGPKLEEVMKLGQSLLGDSFLSKSVDYKEIPGYYAACDVVTLPSSPQENSPMVFLESLAAGKVCVTTDAPRPRWILGEAGMFVNPENVEEYSDKLQMALGNRDNKTIAAQADRYRWEAVVKAYEKVLVS